MEHRLSIAERYTTVRSLHGNVRLLSGYVGECACGARSELYGIIEPCRLWFVNHTDPTGRKARAVKKGIR